MSMSGVATLLSVGEHGDSCLPPASAGLSSWLSAFLDRWGDDEDVRDIAAVLFSRWRRALTEAEARRFMCGDAGMRGLRRAAEEYIDFHGPHLWAGLLTEAGVRAAVRDRRAAEGSY